MNRRTSLYFLALILMGGVPVSANQGGLFEGRVFVMNLGDGEIGLHPQETQSAHEAQVFLGLYEGLVTYDAESLAPLPGAAESWEFTEGQRVLTFRLREGLKFSDGTPLTARHFYQSFLSLLDPSRQAPFAFMLDDVLGASEFRQGQTRNPGRLGIQVLDDRTLVFRLANPTPHFISILCHYSLSPLHPSALNRSVAPALFPTNGPYTLTEASDKVLILKKNPLYWDKDKVAIPEIQILREGDPKEATEAFRRGAIDWLASAIDFQQPIHEESQVLSALYATSYFYFRPQNPVYQDPAVRKALVLLLPLEEFRKNQTFPTANLIPRIEPYPVVKGLEKTNVEEGLKLLKEAGYEKGRGLPALTIMLPEGEDTSKLAQQFLEAWKSQLPELQVQYRPVPWREYYRSQSRVPHDIGYQSWIGDFPDPLTFLSMWESGSSLNTFRFQQMAYDLLIQKSRTQSGAERLATLAQAEEYLLTSGAVIPLGFSVAVNLIDRSSIGGWHPNPFDLHPFKSLYFTAPRSLPGIVYLTN